MSKLIYLILFATISSQAKEAEPKFYKGEQITYKVPFFYHKACSGKGKIRSYHFDTDSNGYTNNILYIIETPENDIIHDCPDNMEVAEKDIKAVE